MENESREAVEAFIRENPGASTRMVARGLRVDDSTADYHLRRLKKQGRIALDVNGRETAWWDASGGYCPVLRRVIPALRREGVLATARALDDWPATALALSARAGLTTQAARGHLDALEKAGVAVRTARGRIARAEGAKQCLGMAEAGTRCDRWGVCPLSQRAGRGRVAGPD